MLSERLPLSITLNPNARLPAPSAFTTAANQSEQGEMLRS
jgi:hypothetical protein